MKNTDKRSALKALVSAVGAASLLALTMGSAQAQGFPVKPVRLVVPFPAGAATDLAARVVASN